MQEPRIVPEKKTADSVFYELTRSICPECKDVIDAQVHLKDGRVIMRKRCPTHGWFEALISSDADSYVNNQKYNKPGTIPLEFSTEVVNGCPLDCGLCPEHKQHACLGLIEVNTGCNLACPICFADAGIGYNLTKEQVELMLDTFIRTEGDPEVVQFSGGEPTIHPELFDFIRLAKDKGIRYIMVNTNGRRIAQDIEYARGLAELNPVIYFQFDGLQDETYVTLRGEPLREEKLKALDHMAEVGLSVILVAAIERGVNEHEVGPLVKFGLEHPAVRGVNFQPVTHTGRHIPFDPTDRVTIPEVLKRIETQTESIFMESDFVPVPCCNPGCQSITYAYVDHGEVTPLPRVLNVDDYLDYVTNRALLPDLSYDIRRSLEALWSASAVPGTEVATEHFSFTCTTCNIDLALSDSDLAKHIFGISVKDFMDAYTFDVKKVMKCCVEVLTPDGRMIPFCSFNNVGYREDVRDSLRLEQARVRLQRYEEYKAGKEAKGS